MLSAIFSDALAQIKGGKAFPEIHGTVYFKKVKNGILLTAKIYGLPQSDNSYTGRFFGFHIHEGVSCTGNAEDEFANVKSHYNPKNCPHPYHAGDLPPLLENKGYAYMSILIDKFNIDDIIGKAVVIHDSPDDFNTQPSGNSGKKIACGIIQK